MQVYLDAEMAQNLLHTSLVYPTHPEVQQTCSYLTDAPLPSIMAERLAIRDGLSSLEPRLRINPPSCLHLYRLHTGSPGTPTRRQVARLECIAF